MTTDKENEAFTAWMVTQSWVQHNQPGFARMAWKARAALDMSDELAEALEVAKKGLRNSCACNYAYDLCRACHSLKALAKYRSMKGEGL